MLGNYSKLPVNLYSHGMPLETLDMLSVDIFISRVSNATIEQNKYLDKGSFEIFTISFY